MFVLRSTYDAMKNRAILTENRYHSLIDLYNKNVRYFNIEQLETNRLRSMLKEMQSMHRQQFNAEDIKRLLQLCHPDKHDGKAIATEMTQKLLKLKESS